MRERPRSSRKAVDEDALKSLIRANEPWAKGAVCRCIIGRNMVCCIIATQQGHSFLKGGLAGLIRQTRTRRLYCVTLLELGLLPLKWHGGGSLFDLKNKKNGAPEDCQEAGDILRYVLTTPQLCIAMAGVMNPEEFWSLDKKKGPFSDTSSQSSPVRPMRGGAAGGAAADRYVTPLHI